MRLLATIALAAMLMPAAAEEVYKTRDAAGNVIYSDKPSPEAETITIPDVQTVPADNAPPFQYTPPPSNAAPYTKASIVSPANDEALRPEDQGVRVVASLEPGFRGQDTVVLFLDGKEQSAGKSSTFLLEDLDRGSHTVRVVVRDPAGKELIGSDSVTFHVLRTTVLKNKAPPPTGKPPKPPKPPKAP